MVSTNYCLIVCKVDVRSTLDCLIVCKVDVQYLCLTV
jgi:hypothetical protein